MNSKPSVLIIFAHPYREQSRVHNALIAAVQDMPRVSVLDLYAEYPDFYIDVAAEQERLLQHDLLIFQHPIYWYSCPPLMKEWMDAVLLRGWAYGAGGDALKGLDYIQVLSTGGPDSAYIRKGESRFSMTELLRPFEAMANMCGWNYYQPFLMQGVNGFDEEQLQVYADLYRQFIERYLDEGNASLVRLDSSKSNEEGQPA
jgi:glutathione-regulated potassium-efflux system ancillary protein KefG